VTFVVDTTVLIDHLRDRPEATEAFREALRSGRRVAGSVLTLVELWRGARPHEADAIAAVEALVDWVPVDHAISRQAARYAESHGREHPGIDVPAYVIAATTARLDADLLTCTVQDFPMFPDLAAPY
jgi:predicted nucleic acid-binding protein